MATTAAQVGGDSLGFVSRPLLVLPLLLWGLAGCADDSLGSSGPGSRYSYAPPEELPPPGLAEGRPVVKVDGVTFYACPPIAVGEKTPLIEDTCLTPGDAGASRYGDYSTLEPSVDCPGGKKATDAGAVGWGFVGEPLIAQRETPPASPERAAVLECLRAATSG